MDDNILQITESVSVPRSELEYRATRSGGPGGQHVNTSSTRIELTWDVGKTTSLTDEQRVRVLQKLANRIDAEGHLHLDASASRSQNQNKEAVTSRFVELLAEALHVPKPRRKTKTPRAVKEARLQEKKRRSDVKRNRGKVVDDD
jgi:ribosome-associated protein